jgi:predicted HNH restriction endonuclease
MKKSPFTPNSRIRALLHLLFMRSRERASALKAGKYTCCKCGVKQSKAKGKEQKVQVHHKKGVLNWEKLFLLVREYLLVDPSQMEVLCPKCHEKEHEK